MLGLFSTKGIPKAAVFPCLSEPDQLHHLFIISGMGLAELVLVLKILTHSSTFFDKDNFQNPTLK